MKKIGILWGAFIRNKKGHALIELIIADGYTCYFLHFNLFGK